MKKYTDYLSQLSLCNQEPLNLSGLQQACTSCLCYNEGMQSGCESVTQGGYANFMFLEYRREKIRDIGNQFRRFNDSLIRVQEIKNRKKDERNDKTFF